MEGVQNARIVALADIKDLTQWRKKQTDTAEELGKFKNTFDSSIKVILADVNKKIAALEKEVADNHQLADLILIEVRALFASSLAKI